MFTTKNKILFLVVISERTAIIIIMRVNSIELVNNDVYFIEVLDNVIAVNDNYRGILIYDSELRKVEKIELIKDLSIYTSFKNGKELLLFCPENDCFIYINIGLHQKKTISLAGFGDWIFSTLYDWNQERLILSDFKGRFLKVDLNHECLSKMDPNDIECQTMREDYAKLSKFKIYKAYTSENKAFIKISDSELGLMEYKHDINILKEFKKKQYHDFELANGYVAKIGESKVEISFKGNTEVYYSLKQYHFLRGKFMLKNEEVYLFLLSGKKSDSDNIKIEKYKLQNEM